MSTRIVLVTIFISNYVYIYIYIYSYTVLGIDQHVRSAETHGSLIEHVSGP